MMKEQSTFAVFEPQKPLHTPSVLVTPVDQPDHELLPIHYWLNGQWGHYEKLTGMAGNVRDN